ncbi:hypothetical protein CFAM422_004264 [Trichoderma lentiforme]|uniref:Uncharacterized protein n=1 Tax=Trichoderma lentiforme TaxID=1567552 RepID=A0A9P5CGZ8_9HYPO|nr:hypothetical protein CFAM422_004264 [Trichoderma lentiforme]
MLTLILLHQIPNPQPPSHSNLNLPLLTTIRLRIPTHLAHRLTLIHALALYRRISPISSLLALIFLLVFFLVGIPLRQLRHVVQVQAHTKGVLPVGVVLALRLLVAEAQRVFVQVSRGDVGHADVQGDVFRLESLHHGKL